ncbi:hypothetical protein AMATHDRAFT_51890 [Amanita thiersii Skay4041]|uniref:Uncharacterized protein n=1 Tax=Amanita thiersii Skay4041 TaxID=703135 RepID=A0A2A9N6I7_9AGAR|nr:hypothetical protein AMATHDRAFT_51890 [Amanita thiersii Skay4041]
MPVPSTPPSTKRSYDLTFESSSSGEETPLPKKTKQAPKLKTSEPITVGGPPGVSTRSSSARTPAVRKVHRFLCISLPPPPSTVSLIKEPVTTDPPAKPKCGRPLKIPTAHPSPDVQVVPVMSTVIFPFLVLLPSARPMTFFIFTDMVTSLQPLP